MLKLNGAIQFKYQIVNLPFSQAASLVFRSAAKPILSLGITRFSILSEPSLLAIASWLNSIRCSFINENLKMLIFFIKKRECFVVRKAFPKKSRFNYIRMHLRIKPLLFNNFSTLATEFCLVSFLCKNVFFSGSRWTWKLLQNVMLSFFWAVSEKPNIQEFSTPFSRII